MTKEPVKNKDCGCDDNCCPPKRKPRWIMFLSIAIFLAALSLIAVKVTHRGSPPAVCEPGKSRCCPSSDTTKCDTSKTSTCCPKPKN